MTEPRTAAGAEQAALAVDLERLHPPTLVTIRCDRESCTSVIAISHDVAEAQATKAARALGWRVVEGSRRNYHHCPRCKNADSKGAP